MRGKVFRWCVSLVILPVIFLPGQPVGAQTQEERAGERGQIEFGVRQLFGDRVSSKFNEYRDIPQGFFIQRSEVNLNNLFDNSFFLNFQTRYTRQKDQSYLFDLGTYRKYRLDVQWDQTPHVFTNTAKTFFVESSPGVFVVPVPLRSLLQIQPTNLQALLDNARVVDMSLRRDVGAGTFTYTPDPNWSVQMGYSREKKTGRRPFGTTMNQFTNVTELPEPIDYRTHLVKAGLEYANKHGGFQARYSGSVFNNEVSSLTWDNAFRTTDIVGGSSQGRLDLYPDNRAHNLSFAGALNFLHSTRLMASIAPGWMRQNDSFLPYTINTAITGIPPLPASSLNGRKQTMAMNYTLTSRAISGFPVTLRYRSYDYNNGTPSLIFSDWVKTDTQLVGTARRSLPYAYDRKTLGLDVSREVMKNSSLKFLYEWERFDRAHRDIERSYEHAVGGAFDLNLRNWLLFKTSYRHSERRPRHYEVNEESFPFGEGPETDPTGVILAFGGPGPGLGQIEGLRKFDEAARGRDRAEALLQVTPSDQVTLGVSYGTTQDDYAKSEYGLQKDINSNYTFELTYTPHPAASLFAEYTREKYKYRQRSRQRSPARPGVAANDNPNNDWESNRRDLVDTWAIGLDGSIIRDKVQFDCFYSLSAAKNSIFTRALGNPALPGFLVTTAQNYPDTSNRWHQVAASLRFPLKGGLTPKFEYRYEKYNRIDFQLVNVGQYLTLDPGSATAIYLGVGADVPGYRAHIIAISMEYRF